MGNPQKPKPLSPYWQRRINTPFVQDTLRALAGGKLPIYMQSSDPPPEKDAVARFVAPDTVKFYMPAVTSDSIGDYVVSHETSHYLDYLNAFPPQLSGRIDATEAEQKKLGGYAATSEDEHFAEAVAAGLHALRQPADQQDAAANAAEQKIRGARMAYDLLTQLIQTNMRPTAAVRVDTTSAQKE